MRCRGSVRGGGGACGEVDEGEQVVDAHEANAASWHACDLHVVLDGGLL